MPSVSRRPQPKLALQNCTCFDPRTFAPKSQRSGSSLSRNGSRNVLLAGGADVHFPCPRKQQQLVDVVPCHPRTCVDIRRARHRSIDRSIGQKGGWSCTTKYSPYGCTAETRVQGVTANLQHCPCLTLWRQPLLGPNGGLLSPTTALIPTIASPNRHHPTANSCSC